MLKIEMSPLVRGENKSLSKFGLSGLKLAERVASPIRDGQKILPDF
jgi:hypothetical protein